MTDIAKLGKHHKLSNCTLVRVDIESDHHYFVNNEYFLSVTRILDVAGPFPEALREWLRNTDAEESKEIFEKKGARGTKLHGALEQLFLGWEVQLADYPTRYEREAIVSFIRVMRFLEPKQWATELVVADPKRRLAGTMDLWCLADERKLNMLLEPTKYLDISPDRLEVKQKYIGLLEGKPKLVSVIIDYKFTGRNTFNHKAQVTAYKHMFNMSYRDKFPRAKRAFTWRYSPTHKNKFDMNESKLPFKVFSRIFETCLDYLGSFPEPPEMNIYPDAVRLFEQPKEVVDDNKES